MLSLLQSIAQRILFVDCWWMCFNISLGGKIVLSIIEYHAHISQLPSFLSSWTFSARHSMLPIVFTNPKWMSSSIQASFLFIDMTHLVKNLILCVNWSAGSGRLSLFWIANIISYVAVLNRTPDLCTDEECNQWSGLQFQESSQIYRRRHFAASKHK